MKTIKLTFLIVIVLISALKSEICFSQLGSFDTSYILLSSSSYDYKNPQFDKSHSSVNYYIKDCIFSYEKWNSTLNSNIGVRFMRFNSLGNEEMLTNDSNLNINPAVSYFTFQPENNPGAIVYQTNRNGNWDIYFSSIKAGNWSQPFKLTTGILDEFTPAIVGNTINNINYYLVTYQRERDIFIKSYYNGIWSAEINITEEDSIFSSTPKLTKSFSGNYLAYLRKLNDTIYSIAFKRIQVQSNGTIAVGTRYIISQPRSQKNIRFSQGINYPILNYDYDTLGTTQSYAASLSNLGDYKIINQTAAFPGSNYGGTTSSHGDITDNVQYTVYSWINKRLDSTNIIVSKRYPLNNPKRFYVGNSSSQTFVNLSSKMVHGISNLFRIRLLWEKNINGRTAIIESYMDDFLTSVLEPTPKSINNYSLSQNYPNPFNPITKIKFYIPEDAGRQTPASRSGQDVRLIVYDAPGKEVATLVNQKLTPGSYEVDFDGTNFPSGIYFYKLLTENPLTSSGQVFSEVRRMILLK